MSDVKAKYPVVTEQFLRQACLVTYKALEAYDDPNLKLLIGEYFSCSPPQVLNSLHSLIKLVKDQYFTFINSSKSRQYIKSLDVILSIAIVESSLSTFLTKVDESIGATKELLNYATQMSNNENVFRESFRSVGIRMTYLHVLPDLTNLHDHINDDSIPLDQFIAGLKDTVKHLSVQFDEDISKGAQIDEFSLQSEVSENVLSRYASLLADQNCIETPFDVMTTAMRGGFAPTRVYVVAGPSGCGKSTLLLNCALNYITNTKPFEDGTKEKFGTVLYITIENLMHETLCRIASWVKGYDVLKKHFKKKNSLEKISNDIKYSIDFLQSECLRNLELRYIAPSPTCVSDIASTIDKIYKQYKDTPYPLEFIIIDFLNPIASFSGGDSNQLRHKLGELTRLFKNFGIEYRVPVITAAQLNRVSYDSSVPLSVAMMGESMQIVDNSDGIILLREIGKSPTSKTLEIRLGKLRNGDDPIFQITMTKGDYKMKETKTSYNFNMGPQQPQQQPQRQHSFVNNNDNYKPNTMDSIL